MYGIFQRCFKRRAIRSNRETTVRANRLALELLESREMLAAIAFEVSAAVDLQALTVWVESQKSVELVVVTCDHLQHAVEAGQETVVDANGTGEETAGKISADSIVFALEGRTSAAELAENLKAIGVDKWCAVDTSSYEFSNIQVGAATTRYDATDQQVNATDMSAKTKNDQSQPTALAIMVNRQQDGSVPDAAAVVDIRQKKNIPPIPDLPLPPTAMLTTISLTGSADELNLPAKLMQATQSDLARRRYFASNAPNEQVKIENRLAAGMLDHYQAFTLIEPFENSHNAIKRPEPKQNEKVQDAAQSRNLKTDKPRLSELSSILNPFSPIQFAYQPAIFAEPVLEFFDSSDRLPNDRWPIADEEFTNLTFMAAVGNSNTKPIEDDHLLTSTISSLVICGMLTEPRILRQLTKTTPEAPSLQ